MYERKRRNALLGSDETDFDEVTINSRAEFDKNNPYLNKFQAESTESDSKEVDYRASVYHSGFRQHGPTALVAAYNMLISVPEKCGSEFWFRIAEYLNFPQITWPKEGSDKKMYQRHFLLPMLNSLEGAGEALEAHGATIAIVRHPFLRLYSAYAGFFTASALYRDRKFGLYWLENSEAFRSLFEKHTSIFEAYDSLQVDATQEIEIMTFAQFIEGVLIHAERTKDRKYELSWSESGEADINPLFSILMPCQYKYKYYIKQERMGIESRQLLESLSIKLPRTHTDDF